MNVLQKALIICYYSWRHMQQANFMFFQLESERRWVSLSKSHTTRVFNYTAFVSYWDDQAI